MAQDMYGMAQGAAQAPQQEEGGGLEQAMLEQSALQQVKGMPTGDTPEALAERILFLFEKAGIFEKVGDPNKIEQLKQEVVAFAEAVVNKDVEGIKNSIIPGILDKYAADFDAVTGMTEEQGLTQAPADLAAQAQQAPMPATAPTMMGGGGLPPTGMGGM
jgi:hypothetical protein